jgi:hypothetical protein
VSDRTGAETSGGSGSRAMPSTVGPASDGDVRLPVHVRWTAEPADAGQRDVRDRPPAAVFVS